MKNDDKSIFSFSDNLKEKENFEVYATKKELNEEAKIRAESDQIIIDDFNILKKAQNNKISELAKQTAEVEEKAKDSQEKIAKIENCFWDEIKRLEKEKTQLKSQLNQANEIFSKKDTEIKKLKKEMASNGRENDLNLRFAEILKFEISEIVTVKSFINQFLKDLIIERMIVRYPGSIWEQDYHLVINGLDYHDVMQGKNLRVTIRASESGKLTGQSSFAIAVTYKYEAILQQKFVEELLQPAIPFSLRNVPENATPDYNIPKEIANVRPLKLLLEDSEFKYLSFKVFGELNAGSYWTDFHRTWQFIRNSYSGTGQSTIGGTKKINNITDLYNNTSGYYHNLFKLIEKRLNDSGVSCQVTKKWVHNSRGDWLIHTLGNLVFNVSETNLKDNQILVSQKRYYYLMVNFEVSFADSAKKLYRGVTLIFCDHLELY